MSIRTTTAKLMSIIATSLCRALRRRRHTKISLYRAARHIVNHHVRSSIFSFFFFLFNYKFYSRHNRVFFFFFFNNKESTSYMVLRYDREVARAAFDNDSRNLGSNRGFARLSEILGTIFFRVTYVKRDFVLNSNYHRHCLEIFLLN